MKAQLLAFYRQEAPDSQGRTLADIWQQSAVWLECTHDYIQWLFPLREASAFSARAPQLTPADIEAFRTESLLRQNLGRSLQLMLNFYGLEATQTEAGQCIQPKAYWDPDLAHWFHVNDHNHLRLTRILRSCALLGLRQEAKALQTCLLDLAKRYPERVADPTRRYWQTALAEN